MLLIVGENDVAGEEIELRGEVVDVLGEVKLTTELGVCDFGEVWLTMTFSFGDVKLCLGDFDIGIVEDGINIGDF